MCRKDIRQAYLTVANFFKIRLIKLINRDTDKNCSKSFSDSNDSSDIAEEIIKQISKLRPFDRSLVFLRSLLYQERKIIVKKKLI